LAVGRDRGRRSPSRAGEASGRRRPGEHLAGPHRRAWPCPVSWCFYIWS